MVGWSPATGSALSAGGQSSPTVIFELTGRKTEREREEARVMEKADCDKHIVVQLGAESQTAA